MSDCPRARNGGEKVGNLQRALYRKSKQDKEVTFVATSPKEVKAGGSGGNAIRIASCMRWGSPTLAAACWSTWRNLCMVCDEDCRTAVFGKTERTVGWEGNGR